MNSAVTYDGTIYTISYKSGASYNIVQAYSVSTNTWSQVSYTGTFGLKGGYAFVLYNAYIYTIGGYDNYASAPSSEVVKYDINTATFSLVDCTGSFPSRYAHTATLYGSKIIVIGGASSTYSPSAVYVLDITYSTWTTLPTIGGSFYARVDHSATLVGNTIYVIGGYSGSVNLNEVWSLDLVTNGWNNIAYTGTFSARTQHSAAAYGNNIYVIGGWDASVPIDAVSYFNVLTNTWSSIPYVNPSPLRFQHAMIQINGVFYIFGGRNAGNDVELTDLATFSIPGNKNITTTTTTTNTNNNTTTTTINNNTTLS